MIGAVSKRLSTLLLLLFIFSLGSASLVGCTAEEITGPDTGSDPGVDPKPDPDPDPDPDPIPSSGTVQLVWDAPTANADGSSPVVDLAGYTLHYGQLAGALTETANAGTLTSLELELDFGTWFFAVSARDIWGNESELSNILQVDLIAPQAAVADDELLAQRKSSGSFDLPSTLSASR